jgi:hypothetical protein
MRENNRKGKIRIEIICSKMRVAPINKKMRKSHLDIICN